MSFLSSFCRAAVLGAVLLGTVRAHAATLTVNSTADTVVEDGALSLREALQSTNNNVDANADVTANRVGAYTSSEQDLIKFALPGTGAQVITLTGGQLAINQGVALQGPGTGRLSISGNDASRIFNITSPANISLLTLRNGKASGSGFAGFGGAIYASGGDRVIVWGCVLTANSGQHGIIFDNNGSTLSLSTSTLSNNSGSGIL